MPVTLSLDEAAAELHAGHVVAVPTESVFGLTVDPAQENALRALLALKARDPSKGFILVASNIDALNDWIEPFTPDMAARILPTWPGPCTWVVPAKQSVSTLLRGKHATLAVRVTSHPVMKALCDAYGSALVSTSANREGEPPARSVDALLQAFDECPAIVAGELGSLAQPTPIYDGCTGKVLRSL